MAVGVACSSGNSESNSAKACVPGQSIQCAGVNGCLGAQACNADGTGYNSCACGSGVGSGSTTAVGGAGSRPGATGGMQTSGWPFGGSIFNTGGSQTLGGQAGLVGGQSGNAGSVGTNGGSNTIQGGTSATTPGGNANCSPVSMAGYTFPAYKPARHIANACTDQAIQQYYTDCYSAGNCTAFSASGAFATCGACLEPTLLTDSSYGPILAVGNTNPPFYETNVAGCEELVGATSCAPKMQIAFLCEYNSCASSCPLLNASSYDALFKCMDSARASTCAQQDTASHCLTTSAQVAACSGSTFQAQFLAIAKIFCQ